MATFYSRNLLSNIVKWLVCRFYLSQIFPGTEAKPVTDYAKKINNDQKNFIVHSMARIRMQYILADFSSGDRYLSLHTW